MAAVLLAPRIIEAQDFDFGDTRTKRLGLFGGGLYAPNDSNADLGWTAGLAFDWRRADSRLGLRLDGLYGAFPVSNLDGGRLEESHIVGLANATVGLLSGDRASPYLIVGGGYAWSRYQFRYFDSVPLLGKGGDVAISGGVGIRFGVGSLRMTLEGRYIEIKPGRNSASLVPLSLGVFF